MDVLSKDDPNLTEKGFKAELTKKKEKEERKEKPEKQKEQVYFCLNFTIVIPLF